MPLPKTKESARISNRQGKRYEQRRAISERINCKVLQVASSLNVKEVLVIVLEVLVLTYFSIPSLFRVSIKLRVIIAVYRKAIPSGQVREVIVGDVMR